MKKFYSILALMCAVLFVSCTNSDVVNDDNGYLMLDVTSVRVNRAVPSDYNPKQLYVEIVNAAGAVVLSTDDASKWAGQMLTLKAGKYTINAHSNNWDGADAGRDIPFYAGTATADVRKGQKSDVELVCTQANVKVSVQFDETVSAAFKSANVVVSSALDGTENQTFVMGDNNTLTSAYFPVGRLTARLTVVNKADETYTMETLITDVRPRDHFIFKYSTKPMGQAGPFTVTADDAQKTFTYTFSVPIHSNTQVKSKAVNAWGTFAYAEGSVTLANGEPDATKATFQYQKDGEEEWIAVPAVFTGENCKATLTDLAPGTDYSCKLVYEGDDETFASPVQKFTTETTPQLPNSTLDDWYTGKFGSNNCLYPCSEAYWKSNGGSFWGTSNAGTSLLNKMVTSEEKSDVHTPGGSAAKLQSQYVVIKFAAASLFAGNFRELVGTSGGIIDFGRPFTSRPTKFTGWFKYSNGAINRVGSGAPSSVKQGETMDTWSCYVALMTEGFAFNNSSVDLIKSTMPDYKTDPRVIAYGEMPVEECGAQPDWKQFSIDIKYRDLVRKPSVVVIVISSSRYGDYFTGYDNSLLLVDDLQLEYGEPIQ